MIQSSALSGTALLSTKSYTFIGQISTQTPSPSQASDTVIVGISFTYPLIPPPSDFKGFLSPVSWVYTGISNGLKTEVPHLIIVLIGINMSCRGLIDDTVTIGIGGEAGQGVGRSGMLLGKALMRAGFYSYGNIDYPSLIRGGHNYYTIRTSHRKVTSILEKPDLIVALDKNTVLLHQMEVNPGGGIIYDATWDLDEKTQTREDIEYYPVPLTDVVEKLEGPRDNAKHCSIGLCCGFNWIKQ